MNKKNSKKLSTWQSFISKIKTNLKPVILNFEEFNRKYPNINQTIQLTFIYFFAIVDLHFAILSNVFSLGYFPELLKPVFPFLKNYPQKPLAKLVSFYKFLEEV